MMYYYNSVKISDNVILSCDMLRLSFQIFDSGFKYISDFINECEYNHKISFSYFESRKLFNYRHLFNIEILDNKSSFALGLCFNSLKNKDIFNCFIEFNPNKTLSFGSLVVKDFINVIRAYCVNLMLVRFDLAVDIPIKRGMVNLVKDLRDYSKHYYLEQKSITCDNYTEYLGQRNKNGFVKLYNKKIEQKLDYDLTRLEITLDNYSYENFKNNFPCVQFLKNFDLFDYNKLNDTDKVLFNLLSESPNKNIYLKMLGRVKQDKFKKLLYNCSMLDISAVDFFSVVKSIKELYF